MPVGAFGGKKEVMQCIAPLGPVYQAGTLSGNPIAMAAGLATLNLIQAPGFHDHLNQQTKKLTDGLQKLADAAGIALTTHQVGGMFGFFFSAEDKIEFFEQVTQCDMDRFKRFYHSMLDNGVYLAPSAFEAGFVSAEHSDNEINATLDAAQKAFAAL